MQGASPADCRNCILAIACDGERLGLAAASISEILRVRPLTRVPHAPDSLLGVFNLRGVVLPVLSLARLLGRVQPDASPRARIVVLDMGTPVGLLVDAVFALAPEAGETLVDVASLLAAVRGLAPDRAKAPAVIRAAETGHAADGPVGRALIGFLVAGQEYALPVDQAAAILALPANVTIVPADDPAMGGVMAWRGSLLPLVSLRVLLGHDAYVPDRAGARVVVTRSGPALVGLVADRMTEILRVKQAAMDKVPAVLTRGRGEARIDSICRLDGGRLVSVLAPLHLFDTAHGAPLEAAGQAEGQADDQAPGAAHDAAMRFVPFALGGEVYGVPIDMVREVVRRPAHLTPVPRTPDFLLGVMNVRGVAVPVIDQRARFGSPAGTGRQIVIVTIDGVQTGICVDSVRAVQQIPASAMQPAPDMNAAGAPVCDRVVLHEGGETLTLLLDPRALVAGIEQDMLAAIAARAIAQPGASGP